MTTNAVGYGQRRVYVTPELLETVLVHGSERAETNLPDDARLLRIYPAEMGHAYVFVFESEAWDELEEGEEIPRFHIEAQTDD